MMFRYRPRLLFYNIIILTVDSKPAVAARHQGVPGQIPPPWQSKVVIIKLYIKIF